MGNIVLLDDLTINKIAAGEVIERPASVVKEIVENSIDAGANNITVEIKNGGISFIKVTDNGKGILPDDLEIAFERHATSKIRNADDLNVVTSMGFRGEALASIAAIANVEMVSKTKKQDTGYKITVEGGNVLDKQEVGCQTGTIITVKNLFYNTPVRYKFLKKDFTEAGYIEDVITRIALVNPGIAIKLINTGKTVIQTNGNGDIKGVIYSIYGKDIATGILPVEYEYEDIKVSGVIGKPEIARSNRSNQLFFVNKRYIKDKTISAATEQAYKGLIPIGRYGFVILNVTMNPAKVDVNVHPAKLEVRFQEENKVFQAIYHAIKDTLLKGELVANTDRKEIDLEQEKQINGLFDFRKNESEKIENYTNKESDIKTNAKRIDDLSINVGQGGPINTADILAKLKEDNTTQNLKNVEKTINTTNTEKVDFVEMYKKYFGVEPVLSEEKLNEELKENEEQNYNKKEDSMPNESEQDTEKQNNFKPDNAESENAEPVNTESNNTDENVIKNKAEAFDVKNDNVSVFEQTEEVKKPEYKFIGIIFNTYIIIEMEKEMYMIDQHAAHERILYEKVKENYYSEKTTDSQMLLIPDIITLSHKDMEIAKENFDMFKKAGFCLEEFGENTIKLTGVPTICVDIDNKQLFLDTLDQINTISRTAKQEKEERFIATVACKAAVKAGMVLTSEEVENLIDGLLKLPNPFTCPHGRPTTIKMTKYEIERKFARK